MVVYPADADEKTKRAARGLALMLEIACQEFEMLQRLITGEMLVAHRNPLYNNEDNYIGVPAYVRRASSIIEMALAKAFLFNSVRAYRIVRDGKGILNLPREDRRLFMDTFGPAVAVRGVNEHGFDVEKANPKPNDRPSMHDHEGGLLDETAMYITGPENIQMGPVNLFDLYATVAALRAIAGFASIPESWPRT